MTNIWLLAVAKKQLRAVIDSATAGKPKSLPCRGRPRRWCCRTPSISA